MAKFKRGSIVKLQSGGPEMTAGGYDNDQVLCYWFNNQQEPKWTSFHEDMLILVYEPK